MVLTWLANFLNSPQLKAFLGQRGYSSIEELHAVFANKDQISTVIKREKLLRFPYSDGLEGVIFEWRTKHQDPESVHHGLTMIQPRLLTSLGIYSPGYIWCIW